MNINKRIWHTEIVSLAYNAGRTINDGINDFQKIQINNINAEHQDALEKISVIQTNIANSIEEAKNKASQGFIGQETAKEIVQFHENILNEIHNLDVINSKVNKLLKKEIDDMKLVLNCMNEFISCTNAESIGIRKIEEEYINSIKIPGRYNPEDFVRAMNRFNSAEMISGILTGGIALGALFSSSKAVKAVGVATGIIAIGAAVIQTIAAEKETREECRKIVECMRQNSDIISENIQYIHAGFEKLNNLIAIKTVAIRYYNQLIDSIGTPLWRYLPIKVLDGYDIRLSSDEIECLKKICETFQNIADRKYITSAPFCSPQILDDNMGCVPLLDD